MSERLYHTKESHDTEEENVREKRRLGLLGVTTLLYYRVLSKKETRYDPYKRDRGTPYQGLIHVSSLISGLLLTPYPSDVPRRLPP